MKEWLEPTGKLIAAIGQAEFPRLLSEALRGIAPFDYTVVFGYLGAARPMDLFDDFPQGKRRIFVEDYQEGPYLLDPFYLACTQPVETGLYRMRDLAPDRFYQGEYFRSYYVQTGLAEEVGYFIDVAGGAMVVVSLMRARKAFSAKEIRDFRQYWPVVSAASRRHWSNLPSRIDSTAGATPDHPMHTSVEQAFANLGEGTLTPREREVVEYTLKGHSADAVGRILGISSGTVRIHRRNIYAKLRIRSQGELFSRFIETLVGDPE
ncbi:helix-turn-helix transcriptional regulator [Defluviimonas sp. WL0024]|uniref:Helix-turn-helix transcriptional regulator n=2 Tax=Albidovulum TaxID=205889 RepID=A0ABT3J472_9RHOB|nr:MULTISPECIES: helix-turn-helix transcriptional regulator [Defluviimonas]MCU9850537.1 helix-turn-helix transcriptional regulator [Defluviimonas sp. WL0024]MCW3782473.1 helix-turn-helix transcriptional regulator [Defluviimonas salinarum]